MLDSNSALILWMSMLLFLLSIYMLYRRYNAIIAKHEITEHALRASEQRFRDLIEGSIQGIFVQIGLQPVFANPATVDIFGYESIEEILELDTVMRFFAAHELERLQQYNEARARGEDVPSTYEVDAVRKDGKPIVVQQTVTVVDWDDQPAVQVVVVDITERKGAERALKASEERFRDFAESASDWFWETDAQLRFTWFSENVESVIGLPRVWYYGKTQQDISELDLMSEDAWCEHMAIIDSRKPYRDFEFSQRGPNGLRWIRSSGIPVFDDDNNFQGYRGTGTDISNLKQVEQLLRERNAALEISNRELQDFAYIASHDLQEPLRKIQAFGDRLSSRYDDVLEDRGRDYLVRMRAAATRMQALINDLLAFSRVTTQKKPFQQVDLDNIVRGVISDLETSIEQRQALIEIGPLHTLDADPLQMRQVMQNLISNSLKYCKEDVRPVVRIDGELIDKGDAYQIRIEDNGIGFDNKYADRIFGIFERLHGRTEKEGTGVGLAIVRKIVERHRGSISADSVVGVGTTFTIILPTRQIQEQSLFSESMR